LDDRHDPIWVLLSFDSFLTYFAVAGDWSDGFVIQQVLV
jgi:hypothetical protein